VNANRLRNFISAPIGERTLTGELTFVLDGDGVPRKIAKILFRPERSDFYLALPYLPLTAYRCGVMQGREGEEVVTRTDENVRTSRVPVKLSFHESGQVHVKAQGAEDVGILASVQAIPIAQLSGQHIFTIELEGITHFAPAKAREIARASTIAIRLPGAPRRIQLVGYAGRSYEDLTAKYPNATPPIGPTFFVHFMRPNLLTPLYLGVYVFTGESLREAGSVQPMELALCGFDRTGGDIRAVFVHGIG
jgi:hypothetical protein